MSEVAAEAELPRVEFDPQLWDRIFEGGNAGKRIRYRVGEQAQVVDAEDVPQLPD